MTEPASIRFKNPGAMWGSPRAVKWGAGKDAVTLNDGLGQGNNIAVFPTYVQGAAAQFDLWRASYTNMTLGAAIRKWSGGNSSPAYAAFLKGKTGLDESSLITASLLAGPIGALLMKAQAQWEAGKPYPMTDADWASAQRMVFGGAPTPNPAPPPIPVPPVAPKPASVPPKPQPARARLNAAFALFLGAIAAGAAAIKTHPAWSALAVALLICAAAAIIVHHTRKP